MKLSLNRFTFFAGGLLAAYLGLARPRMASWGAEASEIAGPQPGDELIPHPLLQTTRSVIVRAPAGRVWKWVAQIGYGRGGFYSYDWLERMAGLEGLRSAERIDPALQELKVGDTVQISPVTPMTVASCQPGRALVLHTLMSPFTAQPLERIRPNEPWMDWTWSFLISPLNEYACRLTSRVRAAYGPYLALWPLMALAVEPASFVMDRKLLETIRARAEATI